MFLNYNWKRQRDFFFPLLPGSFLMRIHFVYLLESVNVLVNCLAKLCEMRWHCCMQKIWKWSLSVCATAVCISCSSVTNFLSLSLSGKAFLSKQEQYLNIFSELTWKGWIINLVQSQELHTLVEKNVSIGVFFFFFKLRENKSKQPYQITDNLF